MADFILGSAITFALIASRAARDERKFAVVHAVDAALGLTVNHVRHRRPQPRVEHSHVGSCVRDAAQCLGNGSGLAHD